MKNAVAPQLAVGQGWRAIAKGVWQRIAAVVDDLKPQIVLFQCEFDFASGAVYGSRLDITGHTQPLAARVAARDAARQAPAAGREVR